MSSALTLNAAAAADGGVAFSNRVLRRLPLPAAWTADLGKFSLTGSWNPRGTGMLGNRGRPNLRGARLPMVLILSRNPRISALIRLLVAAGLGKFRRGLPWNVGNGAGGKAGSSGVGSAACLELRTGPFLSLLVCWRCCCW